MTCIIQGSRNLKVRKSNLYFHRKYFILRNIYVYVNISDHMIILEYAMGTETTRKILIFHVSSNRVADAPFSIINHF